jgi:coenzyme PQQ precursor peptide PqqA
MRWSTPDFEEINLNGEVTAYVNSDEEVRKSEHVPARTETPIAAQQTCAAGAAAQRSPGG